MAVTNQKIRVLRLLELLRTETDDAHCLTTNEICERLNAEGFRIERKTLYDDIALLNQFGFSVETQRCGRGNGYYIADEPFDVSELKIIVDALHAANFITEKKTDALIAKVARLGGKYKEASIRAIDVHFNNHKHSNAHTYYNVETIAAAISEHRKISFVAFNLNYKAKPVYRHRRKRYTEEPLSLVFNRDNYYVILYRADRGLFSRRIDRLAEIDVCDEKISAEAEAHRAEAETFTHSVFGMFTGEKAQVTLQFTGDVLDAVFDQYGEQQKIRKTAADDGTVLYTAVVDVELSPPFWGWVSTFAGKLRITGPDWVIQEYDRWRRNENQILTDISIL